MAKIYKLDQIKKIVFLGTPQFAVPSLEKLINSKYHPCLVVTQPDKAQGRKLKLQAPPVKISSMENGVPVIQPANINSEDVLEKIRDINPDIIITVAYGGFLGKSLRKIPSLGCINLHPSLLPKYRGASPLQTTLFNNDEISGLTIFKIIAAMDAGPIINQMTFKVPESMNIQEYSDYCANLAGDFLLTTLQEIEKDGFILKEQNHHQATYTEKIEKTDLLINWNYSFQRILGQIRGLSPSPGARTNRKGKLIQILKAEYFSSKSEGQAGQVTTVLRNKGIVISCLDGEILVTEVKAPGKKAMSAHAYNLGAKVEIDEIWG